MPAETEVVSCPACRHLLRVPADWLGTQVQCPECQAMFQAPTRDGDRLTEPVLISRPDAPKAASQRKRIDPMLLLPAFGLMLVGFASVVVNGWNSVRYFRDPGAAERDVMQVIEQARKAGVAVTADAGPEGQQAADERQAAEFAPKIRVAIVVLTVVGAFVFYGGLAIALRRHYRMAQLGCVLAAVNVANGCCVPGAVFGLWGILMLLGEEGRSQFK